MQIHGINQSLAFFYSLSLSLSLPFPSFILPFPIPSSSLLPSKVTKFTFIQADANEQVLIVKVPLHSWLQNKTGGLNAGGLFGLVDEITSFVRLLSDIQNRRAVSAYIELKQIDSGIHLLEGSNLILSAK